jgi:hypothetical protein
VAVGLGKCAIRKATTKARTGLCCTTCRGQVYVTCGVRASVKMWQCASAARTRNVFSRYNIVDSDDLHEAMHRLTVRLQKK